MVWLNALRAEKEKLMKPDICVAIANLPVSVSEGPIGAEYYFPVKEAEEIIDLINEMFASKGLDKRYRAVKELFWLFTFFRALV